MYSGDIADSTPRVTNNNRGGQLRSLGVQGLPMTDDSAISTNLRGPAGGLEVPPQTPMQQQGNEFDLGGSDSDSDSDIHSSSYSRGGDDGEEDDASSGEYDTEYDSEEDDVPSVDDDEGSLDLESLRPDQEDYEDDEDSESRSDSESYSESEFEEDMFDDEYDLVSGEKASETKTGGRINNLDEPPSPGSFQFTGLEAVKEVEKLKEEAARTDSLPPQQPPARTSSRDGDDLLRNYMGVLHGSGTRGGSSGGLGASGATGGAGTLRSARSAGSDDTGSSGLGAMEDRISKGAAKSGHDRNNFILNTSLSDVSVQSRSTRVSRREAVMVAQRINFLHDDPAEMTYTRQIALHMMKKYKWYNPRLGEPLEDTEECESTQMGGAYRTPDGYPMRKVKPENPSLEAAWAYFEHFTLSRYVYEPKPVEEKDMMTRIKHRFQKGNKIMERAERNENILPTKLYEPVWTPHNQLGDWGIGWGLYFASVRGWMVLCLLAGLMSIPNMIYFAGQEYSNGPVTDEPLLRASAICTDTDWVPCPFCSGLTRRELPYDRLAYVYNENLQLNITFAIKNNCDGTTVISGMVNFGVVLLVLVGLFVFNRYLMKMEAIYKSDEQTAQSYTVVVRNPPDDATDADEWNSFFTKNLGVAHVVAVTVAVDNDELVKRIVERREKMKMLELLLEPGTILDMNTLAGIAARVDRERGPLSSFLSFIIPGIPELFRRIVVLTIDIRGLAQHDYPARKVFVTFETEADQRRVVEQMAVGSYFVRNDDKSVVKDPKYLFRGEHMLYVREPLEEPNSFRWISMNERFLDRTWQQMLTFIATFASILLVAFIVRIVNSWSQVSTPYL